jgi:hypothetical protein
VPPHQFAEPGFPGASSVPAVRARRDGLLGNRCGFNPEHPRLKPPGIERPAHHWLLAAAWDALPHLYLNRLDRRWWRRHFAPLLAAVHAAEPDYQWRRAELLEAMVLVLRVLVTKLDIRTLQPCWDTPEDEDDLSGPPVKWIASRCSISLSRVKRVFEVLKSSGFELFRFDKAGRRVPLQKREYIPSVRNGGDIIAARWRAKPARRLLTPVLFRCLGLSDQFDSSQNFAKRQWKKNEKARLERARRKAELLQRENEDRAWRNPRPKALPLPIGNLLLPHLESFLPQSQPAKPFLASPRLKLNPEALELRLAQERAAERLQARLKLYHQLRAEGASDERIAQLVRALE